MIKLMRIFGTLLLLGGIVIGFGKVFNQVNRDINETKTETYNTNSETKSSSGTYVPGYITLSGRYRKGHFRKAHSTSPNALKNRLSSQRYYHFKGGKQRRKLKGG